MDILNGFKKVKETKTHTVLAHPDGHVLQIAHKGVKDEGQLKTLKELPKTMKFPGAHAAVRNYADGTPDVPVQPDELPPETAAPDAGTGFMGTGGTGSNGAINSALIAQQQGQQDAPVPQGQPAASPNGPENMPLPGQPQQTGPQGDDPFGAALTFKNFEGGYNKEQKGLSEKADAQAQMGQAQAEAMKAPIEAQQVAADTYKKSLEALNEEHNQLMQQIQSNMINPNHVIQSMDTGHKILAAIGLIAGGFASNGNGAMNVIQGAIQRDIESQMSNQSTRMNLLKANMQQYGNLHDAVQMTNYMQSQIIATKMQQIAAQTQSPMSKANLLTAAGQLQSQAAPILGQMAAQKAILAGNAVMNGTPLDVEQKIPYAFSKEQIPEAQKEMKMIRDASDNKDAIFKTFDQAARETTALKTLLGARDPGSRKTLKLMLTPLCKTEADYKAMEDVLPSQLDFDSTTAEKRAGLLDFLNQRLNAPVLRSKFMAPTKKMTAPPQTAYQNTKDSK